MDVDQANIAPLKAVQRHALLWAELVTYLEQVQAENAALREEVVQLKARVYQDIESSHSPTSSDYFEKFKNGHREPMGRNKEPQPDYKERTLKQELEILDPWDTC